MQAHSLGPIIKRDLRDNGSLWASFPSWRRSGSRCLLCNQTDPMPRYQGMDNHRRDDCIYSEELQQIQEMQWLGQSKCAGRWGLTVMVSSDREPCPEGHDSDSDSRPQ
jgi:hypothetical protein